MKEACALVNLVSSDLVQQVTQRILMLSNLDVKKTIRILIRTMTLLSEISPMPLKRRSHVHKP
eukprot:8315190-Prorocentrum_lima.AAC.1